jgi:hypothetical protein
VLTIGWARAARCGQSVSLAQSDLATVAGWVSGGDGEESPWGGYAFEFVFAAVVEGDARSGHEIDNGPRHENLTGRCGLTYAPCEVDGDAGELGAASFDFTGVDPDPNVEADLACGVADRGPAADGAGGASKVASIPSPVSFSWWPENRPRWRRTASSCRSSTVCQARSPMAATWSVEPTTSVNNNVVSIRVGSAAPRVPVRNS